MGHIAIVRIWMYDVRTYLALIDGGREARVVRSGFDDDLVSHDATREGGGRTAQVIVGSGDGLLGYADQARGSEGEASERVAGCEEW